MLAVVVASNARWKSALEREKKGKERKMRDIRDAANALV